MKDVNQELKLPQFLRRLQKINDPTVIKADKDKDQHWTNFLVFNLYYEYWQERITFSAYSEGIVVI